MHVCPPVRHCPNKTRHDKAAGSSGAQTSTSVQSHAPIRKKRGTHTPKPPNAGAAPVVVLAPAAGVPKAGAAVPVPEVVLAAPNAGAGEGGGGMFGLQWVLELTYMDSSPLERPLCTTYKNRCETRDCTMRCYAALTPLRNTSAHQHQVLSCVWPYHFFSPTYPQLYRMPGSRPRSLH